MIWLMGTHISRVTMIVIQVLKVLPNPKARQAKPKASRAENRATMAMYQWARLSHFLGGKSCQPTCSFFSSALCTSPSTRSCSFILCFLQRRVIIAR